MSDHARLTARLREIDDTLTSLKMERMEVVSRLSYISLVNAMKQIGELSLSRLEDEMNNVGYAPPRACHFTNTTLIAWRHTLTQNFFPNTAALLPEYGPSRMTEEEARVLFTSIAEAIRNDLAALEHA